MRRLVGRFLNRLMAMFGFVRAQKHALVAKRLRVVEGEHRKASKLVDKLRGECQALRTKANDARDRMKAELDRARADGGRFKASAAKSEGARLQAQEMVQKMLKGDAEFEQMRIQAGEAQRELMLAREQLMVVEAKLDILEGASNVLDARTRLIAVKKSSEVGAAQDGAPHSPPR